MQQQLDLPNLPAKRPQLEMFPTIRGQTFYATVSIDETEAKTWRVRTRRDKLGRFVAEIYPYEIEGDIHIDALYPQRWHAKAHLKALLWVRVSPKGKHVDRHIPSTKENQINRFPSTLPPRWCDERKAAILREGSRMAEVLYGF